MTDEDLERRLRRLESKERALDHHGLPVDPLAGLPIQAPPLSDFALAKAKHDAMRREQWLAAKAAEEERERLAAEEAARPKTLRELEAILATAEQQLREAEKTAANAGGLTSTDLSNNFQESWQAKNARRIDRERANHDVSEARLRRDLALEAVIPAREFEARAPQRKAAKKAIPAARRAMQAADDALAKVEPEYSFLEGQALAARCRLRELERQAEE